MSKCLKILVCNLFFLHLLHFCFVGGMFSRSNSHNRVHHENRTRQQAEPLENVLIGGLAPPSSPADISPEGSPVSSPVRVPTYSDDEETIRRNVLYGVNPTFTDQDGQEDPPYDSSSDISHSIASSVPNSRASSPREYNNNFNQYFAHMALVNDDQGVGSIHVDSEQEIDDNNTNVGAVPHLGRNRLRRNHRANRGRLNRRNHENSSSSPRQHNHRTLRRSGSINQP